MTYVNCIFPHQRGDIEGLNVMRAWTVSIFNNKQSAGEKANSTEHLWLSPESEPDAPHYGGFRSYTFAKACTYTLPSEQHDD